MPTIAAITSRPAIAKIHHKFESAMRKISNGEKATSSAKFGSIIFYSPFSF
jgi:hypothetical protein